jgi:hypothetical protein
MIQRATLLTIAIALLALPAWAGDMHGHDKMQADDHGEMHGETPGGMQGAMHGDMHEGMHADVHCGMHAEMHGEMKDVDASGMDLGAAVEHYAAIAEALAGDTLDGLPTDARALRQALALDEDTANESVAGEPGMDAAKASDANPMAILQTLDASTARLTASDLTLEDARAAFKELSGALVPLAEAHFRPPEGDPAWAVYRCPMVAATWIQPEGKTANPYYGSKMLRCGSRVSMLGRGERMEGPMGHGSHASGGDGR